MVRHEAAEALGAVGSLEAVDLLRPEPKKTCSQKNVLSKKHAQKKSSPSRRLVLPIPACPILRGKKKNGITKKAKDKTCSPSSPILSSPSSPILRAHFPSICHTPISSEYVTATCCSPSPPGSTRSIRSPSLETRASSPCTCTTEQHSSPPAYAFDDCNTMRATFIWMLRVD